MEPLQRVTAPTLDVLTILLAAHAPDAATPGAAAPVAATPDAATPVAATPVAAAEAPGAAGVPATPEAPGAAGVPATPGAPATPEASGTAGAPATPDAPGTPGAPATPGVPGAPEGLFGLEIMKRSGRPSGTIYPILERLERQGWITSTWEDHTTTQLHRRRVYSFTPDGAEAARALVPAPTPTE